MSKGVLYMLIASLGFSLMLLSVKMLPPSFPTHEIVFFRSLISLVLTLELMRIYKVKNRLGKKRKILVLRGLFGVSALSLFYYTVQQLPLASAVILQYTSPVFTILFGMILLKEKVSFLQWLMFFTAFAGVVMMKGFEENLSWFFVVLALCSAVLSGLAYNCVRMVKDTDHPLTVVLYFPLVALPVMGIYSCFDWYTPQGTEWLWLLAVGIFTQVGQVFMTLSYHHAQLATVSGVRYLGVVYALAYGFFFFDEVYESGALVGMAIVVGSVLLPLFLQSSHRSEKKQ